MKRKLIDVVMQGFYGNRTYTEISDDRLDAVLQGCLSDCISMRLPPDRTVIRLPGSECVLVYNKYQEEERLERIQEAARDGYVVKPLAAIPHLGLEIYSRCFACRVDAAGNLQDIQPEDELTVFQYLAP